VPIEDLGVSGLPYAMSRRDVLAGNADLLAWCGQLLAGAPRTSLHAMLGKSDVTVTTTSLDELEVYVDGRPAAAARPITDGELSLPRPSAGKTFEIVCRRAGQLVQRRKLRIV
jgi:hypothetical protein